MPIYQELKCESVQEFAWENRHKYNLNALEVSEAVEIAKKSKNIQ
ncbi:MAG: hypothetical protein CM15mP91_0430 [Chloroflexota bacterium]|nr:MAG: hypothetical protein CM15mP91_0430 [Chloroflexota bacterium]